MDTPTQALLGAVVGQAFFSRRLGKRAIKWGAVGGAIPDLDLLPIAFLGPWGEFLYHRGFSHALWFGLVVGPLCGYAARRWYAQGKKAVDPASLGAWIGLFVLALVTHPLLDVFTTYGTQLFTPFSSYRFAVHAVSIIDPVYTLILVSALVIWALAPAHKRLRVGKWAAVVALLLSTAYLFYGLWLNVGAKELVRRQLAAGGMVNVRLGCYPTIFQPYLRRVVAHMDDKVCVGAITMWKPGPIRWKCFTVPENPLIERLRQTKKGKIFEWFALGEVAPRLTSLEDGFLVELNDLRYGLGGPPYQGLWGVRAKFDHQGRMRGEVERFYPPYSASMEKFIDLWRATFGLTPSTPR
jgi:inner membrane protein